MAKKAKKNITPVKSMSAGLGIMHGVRVETTEVIDLRPAAEVTLTAGCRGTVRAVQISTKRAWVKFDGMDSYFVPRDKLKRVRERGLLGKKT
jgi:hypothetical protein